MENRKGGGEMIYLDNAATSFHKPEAVIQAVAEAMRHMGNAGRGAHEAALDASRMIYETRELLSDLFGLGDPGRMVFTANSTESLNIAIQGMFQPGDHVITTALEHNSVLRPLYLMEQRGVELTILPADSWGNLCYDDFERACKPNTRAVVCTHASNLTGNMTDLLWIGEFCREHGLYLAVDASQTAGVFPIDMQSMHIDVLCFTGHKGLMGPQGTGGLCVREGITIRPLLAGGSGIHSYSKTHPPDMPAALEAGTLNGHGIAGLHAAVLYIRETGMDRICEREQELMYRLYEGLKKIPKVTVYGDFTAKLRAPIVTINLADYDSGEVSDELAVTYGIYTRSGAHCAPLMHEALGTRDRGAVRFSISSFNTGEEIDAAVAAVKELALDSNGKVCNIR